MNDSLNHQLLSKSPRFYIQLIVSSVSTIFMEADVSLVGGRWCLNHLLPKQLFSNTSWVRVRVQSLGPVQNTCCSFSCFLNSALKNHILSLGREGANAASKPAKASAEFSDKWHLHLVNTGLLMADTQMADHFVLTFFFFHFLVF